MWMRIVVTLFAILLTVGASMRQERFDRNAEAQRQQTPDTAVFVRK